MQIKKISQILKENKKNENKINHKYDHFVHPLPWRLEPSSKIHLFLISKSRRHFLAGYFINYGEYFQKRVAAQ